MSLVQTGFSCHILELQSYHGLCVFQAAIWICFVVWFVITFIGIFNLLRIGGIPFVPKHKSGKSTDTPVEGPVANDGGIRY